MFSFSFENDSFQYVNHALHLLKVKLTRQKRNKTGGQRKLSGHSSLVSLFFFSGRVCLKKDKNTYNGRILKCLHFQVNRLFGHLSHEPFSYCSFPNEEKNNNLKTKFILKPLNEDVSSLRLE